MPRHHQYEDKCKEKCDFQKLTVCKDAKIGRNLKVEGTTKTRDLIVKEDLKAENAVINNAIINNLTVEGDQTNQGNLNVTGDINASGNANIAGCVSADGLNLQENQENPCANNTVWVKEGSPSQLIFTDNTGQDNIIQTVKDNPDFQIMKGRWILESKKYADWEVVFDFLDTYEDPDFGPVWNINLLAGTRTQLAELTLEQRISAGYVTSTIIPGYTLHGNLKCVSLYQPPDGFFLTWNTINTVRVDDDDPTLMTYNQYELSDVIQSGPPIIFMFRKQSGELLQPVQPFDQPNLYGKDFTDPVFIFNYFAELITKENNPQTAEEANTVGYQGFLPFTSWKTKILQEGVKREFEVLNVLKSQKSRVSDTYGYSTTIITKCQHHLCRASDVTFFGFANEYEELNKTYPVTILDYLNVTYPEPYQSPTGYLYCFNILADTSKFPVFDPAKHTTGGAFGFAQHGPVKNIGANTNNGYRQLLCCLNELQDFLGISTHQFFRPITANLSSPIIPRSIKEMSKLVASQTFNTLYSNTGTLYSTVFNTRRDGDCGNWNTNGALFNPSATSLFTSMLVNDKFNIAPFRNSMWDFNIVRGTYLQPGSFRNIFARNVGAPIGAPGSNISWFLGAFEGWVNQGGVGSTFEFEVFDPANLPPASENWQFIWGSAPAPVGVVPAITSQSAFAGIIRPEFTNGETVGYLRIANFPFVFTWDMLTDSFDGPLASPLNQYIKMYAAFMKYFNSQGVTRVIYDNRSNSGGWVNNVTALTEVFGGNRPGTTYSITYRDNGYRDPVEYSNNIKTCSYPDGIGKVLENSTILHPDKVAEELGADTVFQGSVEERKVVTVLTSKSAGSGGDIVVTGGFVGPDPNDSQNLGSNTYSKIIGTIDGRVFGYGGIQQYFPNDSSYNLITSDGVPVSPIRLQCEAITLKTYVDKRTQKYYNNQVKQWAPSILLDDSYNIIYRNLGYEPLTPGPGDAYLLPTSAFNAIGRTGVPVPGDPNDPTTWPAARLSWRDIWLETAITNGNL
jgi:hypothetical protein